LDWQNPSGPNNTDLTSIEIYVGSNLIYSATTSETTWTHVGLNPKTFYTWILRTKDSSSNLSPGVSVSARTSGPSDPPSNLTGTPQDGKVVLNWAAPSGTITGYNLYQDGVKINSSPITATSYTVNGLTNNQTYQFEVSALNASGESSHSQAVNVTPTALGKIQGLKALERTKTHVKFGWEKESHAERYHIDITIKHKQTAAAGISDSAAGEESSTTFGIETSANDVTVTNLTSGDTVTASVSGYNSTAGLYGTATTTTDVPTTDVPTLTTETGISALDVFTSALSLASNFWPFVLLGLSFVIAPWIYVLLRRSAIARKEKENEIERGKHREVNREIRHGLRGGS
jgi:trimeric autotransporter adhesin